MRPLEFLLLFLFLHNSAPLPIQDDLQFGLDYYYGEVQKLIRRMTVAFASDQENEHVDEKVGDAIKEFGESMSNGFTTTSATPRSLRKMPGADHPMPAVKRPSGLGPIFQGDKMMPGIMDLITGRFLTNNEGFVRLPFMPKALPTPPSLKLPNGEGKVAENMREQLQEHISKNEKPLGDVGSRFNQSFLQSYGYEIVSLFFCIS